MSIFFLVVAGTPIEILISWQRTGQGSISQHCLKVDGWMNEFLPFNFPSKTGVFFFSRF